jgi:hypothetical protein
VAAVLGPKVKHKFKPETTNGGCCFCDCSCGWSGGVYTNRRYAHDAHQQHAEGLFVREIGKEGTTFLVGPRPHGMAAE